MHHLRALAGVGLVGLASGVPFTDNISIKPRQAPGAQNIVYWGQNGGGTIENNDLAAYCQPNSGIDVLVLAFLYQFGNGGNIPSGTIGQSCYISTSGQGQNCEALTAAIQTCQSAGCQDHLVPRRCATSSYSLQTQAQAEQIGQYLWDSYGNSGNKTVQRPFGSNFVNGFDFDIEVNATPFFDHLYVQFYNNNNYTVPCALGINGNAPFNYNNWTSFISNTPSANAKVFIGVPASPLASTGRPAARKYYATPDQLAAIQAKNILVNGAACGSSGPPIPTPTTTPATTTPTTASSTFSPTASPTGGTVPQWGQCGGEGYSGPTQCVPPYKCVKQGDWWSSCR
ncbi:Chitinase 2 [Metarhizium acridum]|nr:Chitinase 2 [Metarhizium acridum]